MKGSTRASLACAETGSCANATYGKQEKRATKIMDTPFIARLAWRQISTLCMRKVMAVAFFGFISRAIRPPAASGSQADVDSTPQNTPHPIARSKKEWHAARAVVHIQTASGKI